MKKGITCHSYKPFLVLNVDFHMSPSKPILWWYQLIESHLMKWFPFFLGIKEIGGPHGEGDGWMILLFNNAWIYFVVSSLSLLYIRCMLMLERRHFCCNDISCWILLLEGNPFSFWNTSSSWLITSTKEIFNF